ncbi:MAG TPA: SGNH/GDSL hydrolase family protein [Sneathiellales bacterium]|nr:SGNH/GDSL hydrolase family protein [Sneathiellales bacterium]
MKKHLFNFFAVVATALTVMVLGEVLLRVKHNDQMSYPVEMWRYAKQLKTLVTDPKLGHVHIPNSLAELQNVSISINSLGMRGPEPPVSDPENLRILLLGSSITLGWGVAEGKILRALLQEQLGGKTEVLNAGVGNYNAERYVTLYSKRLQKLDPDIIIVHYFVNDAEILPPPAGNWFMRNSQMALMLWQAMVNLTVGRDDLKGLEAHYREVYAESSEGRKRMHTALLELDQLAQASGARVILAMMPDIHNLSPYPFGFVHKHMRGFAEHLDWTFVDLLEGFKDVEDPHTLFAIPGDPHPNARGHAIMANVLAPVLERMIASKIDK